MGKFGWCIAGFVYGFMIAPDRPCAEELIASPTQLAYCAIYSREAARIDIMHTRPVDMAMAGPTYPEDLAFAIYKQCVSILPTLLPLPEEHRNLASWNADLVEWIGSQQGTAPALSSPAAPPGWAEQCAAEYVSWDAATGTVIRRGSPERVPCPCGKEVDCGG